MYEYAAVIYDCQTQIGTLEFDDQKRMRYSQQPI